MQHALPQRTALRQSLHVHESWATRLTPSALGFWAIRMHLWGLRYFALHSVQLMAISTCRIFCHAVGIAHDLIAV